MKIELENLYTPWTLDTYQTFTMESELEYIICMENDNAKKENRLAVVLDYDSFDWNYNMDGYRQALAENFIKLLKENIIDGVITGIYSDMKVISSNYYNFTTDKIWIDFTVNAKALDEYIEKNKKDYEDNKIKSVSGFCWFGDEYQTKLNYYLKTESAKRLSVNDYFMDQAENVSGYEYIDYKIKE